MINVSSKQRKVQPLYHWGKTPVPGGYDAEWSPLLVWTTKDTKAAPGGNKIHFLGCSSFRLVSILTELVEGGFKPFHT